MADLGASSVVGVTYPNDFDLKNLTLLSPVATLDIKTLMVEMSYYEDIYCSTTTGYIIVSDAQGYIEKLNLVGNEYLRMTFGKTSTDSIVVDKLFRVYKVSNRRLAEKDSAEYYILHFCSEELILSQQYRVAKSYPGKTITEIVRDICTEKLKIPSSNINEIEETMGVYDFIVPNLKPFEAINWLSTYARPAYTGIGADMFFFENREGYNFKSLQSMYAGNDVTTFIYEPKNVDISVQPLGRAENNVISYEILDSYDALGAVNSGMFANRLLSIDPLLRDYKITDFNYYGYFPQAQSLNAYQLSNNLENRFGDTIAEAPKGALKVAFGNSNQEAKSEYIRTITGSASKDIFIEEWLPNRTAQTALAGYTRIKLIVPGNTKLTVGTVIIFNLLTMQPSATTKEPDRHYSGRYLITAMRHIISQDNDYRTVLEIAKESVTHRYADIGNSTTLWKNSAKGIK